jgi:hypothetical protein
MMAAIGKGDHMATRLLTWLLCAIAAYSSGAASLAHASADPAAELDSLSRASADVKPGLALTRKQIGSGDLLGAMATLERVLINHPEADEALLLHASLLCRLDDREGALIEFDELRGHDFPDQTWAEATAPCEATPGNTGSEG